ncbi:MAG: HEAT repeat domain-containing protein, partial [Actinomycetota bacterium]|nr:HEAT repeat domain-containing protein [Actinomycetota bacterium]
MPTPIETRVFKLLSAIEVPRRTAKVIENMGTEAVTVVSDAALGTYPDLRPKVRSTAVTVLGGMSHPQAREALLLLIHDPHPNLQIRAMRAAGRQKNATAGEKIAQVITNPAAT